MPPKSSSTMNTAINGPRELGNSRRCVRTLTWVRVAMMLLLLGLNVLLVQTCDRRRRSLRQHQQWRRWSGEHQFHATHKAHQPATPSNVPLRRPAECVTTHERRGRASAAAPRERVVSVNSAFCPSERSRWKCCDTKRARMPNSETASRRWPATTTSLHTPLRPRRCETIRSASCSSTVVALPT